MMDCTPAAKCRLNQIEACPGQFCFLLSLDICSLDTCNACRVPFFAKRSETALISSKSRLVGLYRRKIRLIECNAKAKTLYM